MSSPIKLPSLSEGMSSLLTAANHTESAENDHITGLFLNAICRYNYNCETKLPIETLTALAKSLAQVVEARQISSREISKLINGNYLNVRVFVENESLIKVFSKVIEKTLVSCKNGDPKDSSGKYRRTLLKLTSLAFDSETLANKGSSVCVGKKTYLIRLKVKKAEMYALDLSTKRLISKCAYLTVSRVFELMTNTIIVIKEPNVSDTKHIKKILQEKAIRKDLHRLQLAKKLPTKDLQIVPFSVIGIVRRNKNEPIPLISVQGGACLIEEKYDMDLTDQIYLWRNLNSDDKKLSFENRVGMCQMLLKNLEAFHANGYAHGDIKTDNILVKTLNDHNIAHIADLGDATNQTMILKDFEAFKLKPRGVYTQDWSLPADLERERITGTLRDPEQASELAIKYRQQRDVFALGLVITCILSGVQTPYELHSSDEYAHLIIPFPRLGLPRFEQSMKAIVPDDKYDELIAFTDRMVAHDPDNRLTAPQAVEEFNKIFEINYI